MVDVKDFDNDFENKWCPGCGNFGIQTAMKEAFARMGLGPDQVLLISGIGQAAKTPHFLNCNYFHTLHGRALAVATGAKVANHDLNIIVNSGDGDCYGEGGNHFLNAVRRNLDITLLVHDNQVYGLTKGQASPTSDRGMKTKVQPQGVILEPFHPLSVALSLGAGFVARAFSGNTDQIRDRIEEAMNFRGFAIIDIFQPCISFNRVNTWQWYNQRVYDLAETDHDPGDLEAALTLARTWGEKLPVGLFYKREKPSFTEQISVLQDGTLLSREYDGQKLQAFLDEL